MAVQKGLLLAAVIAIMAILGNKIASSPRTVSIYPWLFSFFVIPVLLYPVLWFYTERRDAIKYAERVVRWAAMAIGVFSFPYCLFYFHQKHVWLSFFAAVIATLETWVIGMIWVMIYFSIIWLLKKFWRRSESSQLR